MHRVGFTIVRLIYLKANFSDMLCPILNHSPVLQQSIKKYENICGILFKTETRVLLQ
jgi:hypothetical protein